MFSGLWSMVLPSSVNTKSGPSMPMDARVRTTVKTVKRGKGGVVKCVTRSFEKGCGGRPNDRGKHGCFDWFHIVCGLIYFVYNFIAPAPTTTSNHVYHHHDHHAPTPILLGLLRLIFTVLLVILKLPLKALGLV
mmetsp:Transcript_14783/g.27352  ORF Transcript_14783/g.27352 Transcript_14783/m.27352 type:complete len:134 (+) Transcript_14783:333-734(+)